MSADKIVTVRLPSTMLRELKSHTQQDHFFDLSEQVRSIIRKGCLRQSQQQPTESLKKELIQKAKDARAEALLESLKELLDEYRGEAR
jgi:Arc/MetJ-type ribon-helix-helix transcriptional regulator